VERSRLDWSEPTKEPHARLLAWYRDLIRLRHERFDLGDPRLDRIQVTHDEPAHTVLVGRGRHAIAVNVGDAPAELEVAASGLEVLLAWEPTTTVEQGVLSLPPRSAAVLGPA
jgi:maltooligosyltrehalose trehalohydrolase